MGITIQDIKDKLERAREYADSASSYADDAESNSSSARNNADSASNLIDEIQSEIDDLVGFNPETLRQHTVLQQRLIRLQAYIAKRSMDIIDGDSITDLEGDNVRGLLTIIDRLTSMDGAYNEIIGWDDNFHIRWNYTDGSYIVERKEKDNV